MTIAILILSILLALSLFYLLYRLNGAIAAFDSLIIKFIESNQNFYDFQRAAKSKDLELNTAMAKSNVEMRERLKELEKTSKTLSDKIRQVSDMLMYRDKAVVKPDAQLSELKHILMKGKVHADNRKPDNKVTDREVP